MGLTPVQAVWVVLLIWAMLFVTAFVFVPGFAFAEEEPVFAVTAWVMTQDFRPPAWGECPPDYYFDKIRGSCLSNEFDYQKIPIYHVTGDTIGKYCKNKHAAGCFEPIGRIIYIVKGTEGGTPTYGGCNVLWHELGHAGGKTHDWMKNHWPNDKCKTKR